MWCPRQTGKSTLPRLLFPDALACDLLSPREFRRLSADPGVFAEECAALPVTRQPAIVDEIQKRPALLDEVHSLIIRRGLRFILTASRPRKLLRGGGNLPGGRAVRHDLLPLTSAELPDLSLDTALNRGLLHSHHLSTRAPSRLAAYVGDYRREEVLAEAITRNLPAFQRFLEAAAWSNGQIVNAATIAREIGVAANTVRRSFDILVDTLIATWVPAWTKRTKRRVIQAPRFWFFDVGIVNELSRRGTLVPSSTDYGAAFEHFIFMELRAHATYAPRDTGLPISYWRTASGIEVDFILGNAEVAVEVKSTNRPASDQLKDLRAWQEEHPQSRCILVCRAPRARRAESGIEILPWREFLMRLWNNEIRGRAWPVGQPA